MDIAFKIDDVPATFSRNWFTGSAVLSAGGKRIVLRSAWNPGTHVSVQLTRFYKVSILNHNILIEADRPLLLAGIRPHAYRVFVDDQLVAEKAGY